MSFCKIWQAHPKMNMEMQGTQNGQNNLEKEQRWSTNTLDFKTYLEVTVNKRM